jgi:adenylate cyclase
MAKVFISYSREDLDRAKSLSEALGLHGHEVWWDRHIEGGSRFVNEIDRALKDAAAIIVLWSEASVASAWVQDEAAEGRETGRLVPVLIQSCKPPLGFRQYQSIDLTGWTGDGEPAHFASLLRAIDQTIASAGKQSDTSAAKAAAPAADVRKPTICVLPFVNMSGDPEQEYFSDGISEDIITDLSKVSALNIIARNTAFNFKNKEVDVKEIGSALDASHVLEGSVRKAGGRVRINAQLIDTAAGHQVWADRYDRELSDIFELQDEISKAIVGALRLKLLPDEKKAIETRGTSNVDAYNLYLKARQHWISGNDGNSRRDEVVVRICRQAVTLDPNYARAWALMALAQSELRFRHDRDEDARGSAERALHLDPALAEGHCVKARYLADEEGKPDEAWAEIETALRLDSESWEANKEAGRFLFRQGRMEAAVPYFEKAAQLVETDFHSLGLLQTCYGGIGDAENLQRAAKGVVSRAERALAQDPSNGSALGMGATSLSELGEVERAKEWAQSAMLMDPDNFTMRYNLVCSFAKRDGDAAIDLLGSFIDRINKMLVTHIAVDPDLDGIRNDQRFVEMVDRARTRVGIVKPA